MSTQHATAPRASQQQDPAQRYLNAMEKAGLCRNRGDLLFALQWLFDGIDLRGKRVLDIGGGTGKYSHYAGVMGAKEVLCLEPEAEGSHGGMIDRFGALASELGQPQVQQRAATLQGFDSGGKQFDIVLLHNSINHMDEPACIALHKEPAARATYRELFAKIHSLCAPGALLIVCDCSPRNFYARLGVRNPVNPSIEWHKHQPPELWVEILTDVGFANPDVRWTPIAQLRHVGRALLANRTMSYFLRSHFRLTMERPRNAQ